MQLDLINQEIELPTLRDYQEKFISDVRQSLMAGNKRIIAQSPVGSGKTVCAVEIIRLAISKRKRVLFIAPRRTLIYQTVEALEEYGIQAGVIMAGESRFTMPLVQVASFDTITARVGRGVMELPEAHMVICDEQHMCMSPSRLKILEHYPVVIGLTATPALANGKGLGPFFTDIVESLPVSEMVKQNYLVPMRYFVGESPDLSGAKLNKDGDYTEKFLEAANDKPALIGSVYENWKRIAGDRCTLVFAVNRKHARHLHDEFLSHGVTTEYIDGNTEPDERERIKQSVMSGKTQVIVNIGVMVAGVNWPKIDCIVMARQTKNVTTWIQCLGRGSRLYPGKKDCKVIYHGSNFEELGMLDDPIEWSLDNKTTVKERKQKEKEAKKEPKDITCGDCGTVFKSRRDCPLCGYESIPATQPIPVHEAELKEVKVSAVDKQNWYAQLLYYAQSKGYKRGFADYKFKEKFGHFPAKKNGIQPVPPGQEVLNYIKYLNIRNAKRNAA